MLRIFSVLLFLSISINLSAQREQRLLDSECATLELLDRLDEAERCANQLLKSASDSVSITTAYCVLARVHDEYYEFDSAQIFYNKALKHLPKVNQSRFLVFNDLASFYYSYGIPDSSTKYYQLAVSESTTLNDSIATLFSLASELYYQDKFKQVDSIIASTSKLVNSTDSTAVAQYNLSYGLHLFDTENYINSIKYFATAKEYYAKLNQFEKLGTVNFYMADAFSTVNNYARAVGLYKNTLKIRQDFNSYEILNTMNSLGWSYWRINEIDSALFYIQSCLRLYDEKAPNSILKAYPQGNLGLIYNGLDSLNKAREASQEAIRLFEIMGYPIGKAEALNNIANTYIKEEKFDLAEDYFNKAKAIIDTIWYEPYEDMNALNGLAKIASHKGEHEKAYTLLLTATNIKDSLFNLDVAAALQVEEMNRALNLVQTNLQAVQQDNSEKTADIKRRNLALAAFSSILLVLVASIILITISWRQRQKAIRMQSETLSINQEIIRMISHDFRGPMNNIRSLMEILKTEGLDKEEFEELSDVIYQQTCDISLMFETFVGWALSQSDNYTPKTENTDWTDTVDGVVNLLAPLAAIKNMNISVEKDGDHNLVTDRIAAQLVLRNLVSNAIKFSNEGEEIIIRIVNHHKIIITSIIDHGVGMDTERLKQLFDHDLESKKGTHKESESGLGLKMALKFAELNGGRIDVKSIVNGGSTFTYRLPITPPSA